MRAVLPVGGVMARVGAAVGAVVLLAGCQQKAEPPAESAPASSDVASDSATASDEASASQASSASETSTVPGGQKAGLWKLTQTLPQMDSTWISHICVDADQGARLAMVGQDLLGKPEMSRLSCTRAGVVSKDGGIEAETVCRVNDTTLTSHIHADIVGDDVFHQTVETRYSPAFAGHGDQITVTDAKWQGACPPGMQAGDFVNRDGVHSNVSAVLAKFR